MKSKLYTLNGSPTNFYVWDVKKGLPSDWVRGKASLWHNLRRLKERSSPLFEEACRGIFSSNPHPILGKKGG